MQLKYVFLHVLQFYYTFYRETNKNDCSRIGQWTPQN